MRYKKMTAILISAALALGAFSGCGREAGEKDTLPTLETGRYVEEEQSLPDEWKGWEVKQLFSEGGKIHLLMAKTEEDVLKLQEWEQQGETFADVSEGWLSTVELPPQEWMQLSLIKDGAGVKYLFAEYVEEEEQFYKGHLWRSNGDTAVDITPEKWKTPDERWGAYEIINGIAALDNGTLVANTALAVDVLNGEDGTVLESEPTENYSGVFSDGKNIYLPILDNGGGVTEIEKRPGGRSADAEFIPYGQNNGGEILLCAMADGTLISAGPDGIFRCEAGTDSWDKLLSGSETDFSLTDRWCVGLAAPEEGKIYALFKSEEGQVTLKKYEYDPDAVTEVKETLKLYAVEESYLLQNALALYHREHPDVMIEAEYAYTSNEIYSGKVIDYSEAYQKLNTMLMGDNAPDILVLDHLDIQSFASKGLLADINEIVSPYEERGEVLKEITGSYVEENGSRYAVPLQFGFTYITGRDIGVEDMQTLESLAAFLKGKSESYLGQQTVAELVDKFYPFFCDDIVKGKELDKEVLKEKLEALKAIGDNSGMVVCHDDSNGRDGRCYNIWDLAAHAKLALEGGSGFNDCMFAVAITEYIKGDFTAFENSYTPLTLMGICTKSDYQDTAKDFLKFVLSEAVQKTDYYNGFPINVACLEKLAVTDRSDVSAYTDIEAEDGSRVGFEILPYSAETAQKLADLCKGLNHPRKEDAKIREVLIDSLEEYLMGSGTVEDAVAKIEAGLKMYLAE